jgi:hypothetical protein
VGAPRRVRIELDHGGARALHAALTSALAAGVVDWTCQACSRTWLVYLQAHTHDGAPAYRSPDLGDHNRPRWRSGR